MTLESVGQKAQNDTSQFLTFQLGGEEYGLDILSVQEIRGYVQPTRLPNSPPHVTGVLNLRGAIVPLYDLRRMFDLEQIEYDQFAAIVVATINSSVVGLVVDRVSEVITAATSDIQPAPNVGNSSGQDCVRGILRHEEQLIILLDAHALINGDEIDLSLAA
jgi:purine-binding chemotaxis protein CheW